MVAKKEDRMVDGGGDGGVGAGKSERTSVNEGTRRDVEWGRESKVE